MGDVSFRTGLVIGGLAVAVVALVVALIANSGGGNETTTTIQSVANPAPTTAAAGTTSTTAPSAGRTTTSPAGVSSVAFRSPSGNIVCKVAGNEAVCAITEFSYTPSSAPASCADSQGWGHVVGVDGSAGASFVCADNQPADPNSPVLAYGRGVLVGRMACGSTQGGVRCANRDTRHGFLISREQVRLF